MTTLDTSVNDVQLRLARGRPARIRATAEFLVRLNRTKAHVKAVIEISQRHRTRISHRRPYCSSEELFPSRSLFAPRNPARLDHVPVSANSGAEALPLVRGSNHVNFTKKEDSDT